VVNLIPSRSKDNLKNNLYVKHIPYDFSDEDLKQMFHQYGQVTSASVSKDDKGIGKGFGFICFSNSSEADSAFKDLKQKNMSFPGLPPLYVNYAMKKEERNAYLYKGDTDVKNENTKLIAFLAVEFDPDIVILFY
jgi:RNA recognition motif-containing protein